MKLTGRIWKLGDDVGATDLLPAAYDRLASRGEWADCVPHILEELRPDFQAGKQQGDIIVAGVNLGTGHAHYHRGGVLGPRAAGVAAMLGETVNGLFLRSAIDEGCSVWPIAGITAFVSDGDVLEIDLAAGTARNVTCGTTMSFPAVDGIILDILSAGSVMDWAVNRFEAAA